VHNVENIESIGPTVRRLRIERGMNQLQLAARSGTSIGTVSKIENNQRGASVRSLAAIADALEVEIADLFEES